MSIQFFVQSISSSVIKQNPEGIHNVNVLRIWCLQHEKSFLMEIREETADKKAVDRRLTVVRKN